MKRKIIFSIVVFVLLISSGIAFATTVNYSAIWIPPQGGSVYTNSAVQDVTSTQAKNNCTYNSMGYQNCSRVYTDSGIGCSYLYYWITGIKYHTYYDGYGGAGQVYKLKIESDDLAPYPTQITGYFDTSR